MDLSIFGSPGRTSVEDERDLSSHGRTEVRKAKLQVFGSQGSAEVRKRSFTSLKVPEEMKRGSGLTYTWKSWQNKCGRRTRSFEVCGSTESGTSELWQSRQSRSAEAELHIFGSPGRDEMRKWAYPFGSPGRTSAEEERDLSPGRAEVRKAELLIFGSKDGSELRKQSFRPLKSWQSRADVQKLNFISLAAKAGRKCGSGTSHLTKNWQSRSVERISCHIIGSQAK